MAKEKKRKVLILGRGEIGANENTYMDGNEIQCCLSMLEEGYEAVLLTNAHPGVVVEPALKQMPIYHLPITRHFVNEVVESEQPAAVLSLFGDSTAWELTKQMAKEGYWDENNVEVLGTKKSFLNLTGDLKNRRMLVENAGLSQCKCGEAYSYEEVEKIIEAMGGMPITLKNVFDPDQKGVEVIWKESKLRQKVLLQLEKSSLHKIWVEECIYGHKEIEVGMLRDRKGDTEIIFTAENINPVGIHSHDSMTITPVQTLSVTEYEKLLEAALTLSQTFEGFTGYCLIRFAMAPEGEAIKVIGMDFQVDRSSAFVSLAIGGFPIAKIITHLVLGSTLDDINRYFEFNDMTASERVILRVPRFNFVNAYNGDEILNSHAKSLGDDIYAGYSFCEVINKAWHKMGPCNSKDRNMVRSRIIKPYWDQLLYIQQAFKGEISVEEIEDVTSLDPWFLQQLKEIADFEKPLEKESIDSITKGRLSDLKFQGFLDTQIAGNLSSNGTVNEFDVSLKREQYSLHASIDTETVHGILSYHAPRKTRPRSSRKNKKLLVCIGKADDNYQVPVDVFVREAKQMGFTIVVANNDAGSIPYWLTLAERLYTEPLTWEFIFRIYRQETPHGIILEGDKLIQSDVGRRLKEMGIPVFNIVSGVSYLSVKK